jgi:hypothetical protein
LNFFGAELIDSATTLVNSSSTRCLVISIENGWCCFKVEIKISGFLVVAKATDAINNVYDDLALFFGKSTAWISVKLKKEAPRMYEKKGRKKTLQTGRKTEKYVLGKTPPDAMVTPPRRRLSSSSFFTARVMWRGTIRLFLLSRAAFPASSKISAQRYSNTAARYTGAPAPIRVAYF